MPATLTLPDGAAFVVAEWTINPPPIEYIRSLRASLPDSRWSVVDEHGHDHRWALLGRDALRDPNALPTLVRSSEHVDCDGSCPNWDCEGYSVDVWHCVQCGDKVEPGFIPDMQAQTTGIPLVVGSGSLDLVVQDELSAVAAASPRDPLVVTFDNGEGERVSGRAVITQRMRRGSTDGMQVETRLCMEMLPDHV